MKKIIAILEQLPKWYGIGVVVVYALLFAEFFSIISSLLSQFDDSFGSILKTITRMNYVTNSLSCIIVWVIMTFLFHLTALLFNGQSSFGRFLIVSSYPYLILVITIFAGILLTDKIEIPKTTDINIVTALMNNSTFKLATNLINYSFVLYYLLIAIIIHYVYQIKYVYAILSIVLPIVSIGLITELFKLI